MAKKGFEGQWIDSYEGWEEIDYLVIQFYGIVPNTFTEEGQSIPEQVSTLVFDFQRNFVEGYNDNEDDAIYYRNFKVVLEDD